jgi:DNA polymerase-1
MDSQPNKPRRLLAIDSMNLLSRAYHGIPLAFDSENRPNNALRGWFSAWFLIREQLEPDQIIAVFDGGRDLERLKVLPEYKSNRSEKPDEYTQQVEVAYAFCGAMGILPYRREGVEADDILYTLSLAVPKDSEFFIFSNDKDLAQCIKPGCKLVKSTPKDGRNSFELWGEPEVVKQFGVRPDQMALYLALVGDPSDNIPGVAQIGPKTASKLLAQYPDQGTLVQAPEMNGEGKWQSLSTSLEVTQAKVVPGIVWPPLVEESDIDYELIEVMCRKRSLVRTAEKLALRLRDSRRASTVAAPGPVPAPAAAAICKRSNEQRLL